MNIFFGLPVPMENIQIFLERLFAEHPHWRNHPKIRWTAVDDHHVTIHFFGAIAPSALKNLTENLTDYLKNIRDFSIKINKLSNFPNENSDVIAAYVHLSTELAHLYREVRQAVQDHQFAVESRPYLPHITLCRTQRRNPLTMTPIILPDYSIAINKLILYQTQTNPSGGRYTILQEWPLTPLG